MSYRVASELQVDKLRMGESIVAGFAMKPTGGGPWAVEIGPQSRYGWSVGSVSYGKIVTEQACELPEAMGFARDWLTQSGLHVREHTVFPQEPKTPRLGLAHFAITRS